MAAAPQSRYHHGDLRAALLAAALAQVETGGVATLSLRGVARSAGVSAMAPYHHFADRAALLAAVAEIGFHRLYAEKLAAIAGKEKDARAALAAGTRAYVGFIIANPALYRLMKSPELAERSAFPALAAAARLPGERLAALVAGLGPLQVPVPAVAQLLWAFAHGTGLLAIDGYIVGDPLALAEAGALALIDGLVPISAANADA
jgi:AcrR family transcriptional regulator